MPATPQTLFIPFKGGLDTYSNSQLLVPGYLTAALGAMLDRAGTAYPGPGFTPTQWAPSTGETWQNHGVMALNNGASTNDDQLLLWSTLPGGSGPGISGVGTSATAPVQQRLAPWRQATDRILGDSQTYLASTYGSMTGPPQTAACGNIAMYVWLATSAGCVQMMTQDLDTRALTGPYSLNTAYAWSSNSFAALASVVKVAIAGDGKYFRVAFQIGTTLTIATYLATSPLPLAVAITTAAATINNIDATGTGDESTTGYGAVIAYDSANNKVLGYSFASTATTISAPVDLVTGVGTADTYPITCSPIRSTTVSTGFLFMALDGSGQPLVTTTTLTLGTVVQTTVTIVAFAGGARALSIINTVSGSGATVAIAGEYVGSVPNWNRVYLGVVTLAAPSVTVSTSTINAWGGVALLGKFYAWYNGAEFRPLIPLRTGWWNITGAWGTLTVTGVGTFAYPNGYLYDYTGTLYARFGDADVGTDSLWAAFDAGGYVGSSLQPVPSGFSFILDSGQRTLNYAWPQMGHVDFVSNRTADRGSPIGGRAGLSTVTWLAPTPAEPPAQAVQFGGELIIPGAITAIFDGSNVFEAGFFHRAPTPIVTSNGGGGSLPDATTYLFQSVMVYQDAAGRVHYSAPSLVVSALTTAASDKFNITQYGPMQQTLRSDISHPITVQIYRSTGGATITNAVMYPVSTIHLINGGVITASDGTSDANLSQQAPIYTYGYATGAATGTDAPPPFDSITVWDNQVWGIAQRNGPELWCTWPLDDSVLSPEGATFSNANTVAIPAEVGQPKAVVGLDEKLILLGTRADYGLVGQAPARSSSLADNPTFSAPILMPTPGGAERCRQAPQGPAVPRHPRLHFVG